MEATWKILIGNFASVAFLISAWMHVSYRLHRLTRLQENVCFGLMLGLAAVVSMILSVEFEPGVYFDLRLALIELSAMFGGPIAVLLTATLAALCRLVMGGAVVPALSGIAVASVIGAGIWLLTGRGRNVGPLTILVFAVFVGALSVMLPALLPQKTFIHAIETVGIPIAVLNFGAAIVGAVVITYFRRFTLERDILRAALAQAPDFHYVKDIDHRFLATNLNVARHHDREHASEMVGLGDGDLETAERANELLLIERQVLETGVPIIGFEECIARPGEELRWFSTSKVPLRGRHGELIGLGGVTIDITDRKRLEQDLQSSRDIVTQATAEMSDGLALFDTQSRLLFCNTQYRDLFPRSAYARVQGAHIADILAAVVLTGERENMPIEMTKESIGEAAATLHENKDETFRLYDGRWIQMRTRVGQNGSVLVVASDVTAAKESELVLRKLAEQMKGLAETDALTGVANRRSFDSRLAQEVQDAAKGAYPLALLLIDVDRFKAYNDMYGHLAGDSCLKLIGRCLSDAAKCEDDLPARYGGEEFAIILPRRNGEEALAAANALRHRVWDLRAGSGNLHSGDKWSFCLTSA